MTKTRTQTKRFDKETTNALELENMYDTVSSLSSLCGEKNQHLLDRLVNQIMRLRDSEINWAVMSMEWEEMYEVRERMLKNYGARRTCKKYGL